MNMTKFTAVFMGMSFSLMAQTLAAETPMAEVKFSPKSHSKTSGKISFTQIGKTVRIKGKLVGLKPNSVHGFHVHAKGDCSSQDGKSTGGHFNPANSNHGSPGALLHHAGDLGNIAANAKGEAYIDKEFNYISLRKDDSDFIVGKAIIIHNAEDDLTSQPSGDAGKRIACGVIKES